jgi:para-aminobenzoate synthetase component 1
MPLCTVIPLPYQPNPSALFAKIANAPHAVLLDSGRPGSVRGRYDIASAWPIEIFTAEDSESGDAFFSRLRSGLDRMGHIEEQADDDLPFCGGLIGYLSYDFGRRLEHLPQDAVDDIGLPDATLGLYDWALITDHVRNTTQVIFHSCASSSRRAFVLEQLRSTVDQEVQPFRLDRAFTPDIDARTYQYAIERIQHYIQSGDCYQVNFTQRFSSRFQGSPWDAYQRLRLACPTPYSSYLAVGDEQAVLSLSPEQFISVNKRQIETRPIKGTRPRSPVVTEDHNNAEELRHSVKDRAENLMIVDLLRNDLGRSCTPGSVNVPELFTLESYPNVHHLVSAIRGELSEDKDVFDLLCGSFPGGSITGAPKIRAMQIIDELEPTRRSVYCGSILYIDVRGRMDSSICIRTLLAGQGRIHCWGGGAIVADSECKSEYTESITKVRLLLDTLSKAV